MPREIKDFSINQRNKDKMKAVSKSEIYRDVRKAFDNKKNISMEFLDKKSNYIVVINMAFKEREVFVDENGVRWVRE